MTENLLVVSRDWVRRGGLEGVRMGRREGLQEITRKLLNGYLHYFDCGDGFTS